MKQKARRHTGTWIILLLIAAAVAVYFLFFGQGEKPAEPPSHRASEPAKAGEEHQPAPAETHPVPALKEETESAAEAPAEPEGEGEEMLEPAKAASEADPCERAERDVRDFFLYLDGKT